jgi:hypothetical protein
MILRAGRVGPLVPLAFTVLLALLAAACDVLAQPSSSPRPTEEELVTPPPPGAARVLACLGINPVECNLVARTVLAALPPDRGSPFSMRVWLHRCADETAECAASLAARNGTVEVQYADEGIPFAYTVAGMPQQPAIELVEQGSGAWTDPIQPGSPAVEDDAQGPFEFEVGHCGLLHVIDFDGSFWVLVGDVPADHQALGSSEVGAIRVVTQERAEYLGTANARFELARFPGPKRFQPCR